MLKLIPPLVPPLLRGELKGGSQESQEPLLIAIGNATLNSYHLCKLCQLLSPNWIYPLN